MAEIGVFFGSDEGNTESVAYRIQARFGKDECDVKDIADSTVLDFESYGLLILGIPSWVFGQIQSDWEEFWDQLSELNIAGKKVALFGLGDQFGYGDFFLDAMGMLYDELQEASCEFIGFWPVAGYEFDASKAVKEEGYFCGLALDEDQQAELTSKRLNEWCECLIEQSDLALVSLELDD